MRSFLFIFLLLQICLSNHSTGEDWSEFKDKHFVVYYTMSEDESWARVLLQKAEEYYDRIALEIGYSRYSNFWTWEDRVKIIIFADQKTYLQKTGQPKWSTGYSNRDSQLFKSRVIVTYHQENDFIDGLLPHEISHLILRDFIGFDRQIPLWFDEGVAQLNEANKKILADTLMKKLVKQNQFIPFEVLTTRDIRQETDSKKAIRFYLESVSVVDFLIKEYGHSAFGDLCRGLKDGKDIEDAIRGAYSGSIDSIVSLQEQWVKYMQKQ